ncbi:hypothetical protein ACQ4PT_030141 [Festuca glaucescens]
MLPRYRGTLLADLTSGPSCAGKILNSSSLREKINDSSTMLLYETPSGFAIISFGGVDLSIPLEELWAYPPQNVRIEEYKKFCGSEQELLVGSAEYKRIIEGNLAIICRYDSIVEEVILGLENMILLPEETSEPKEYRLPRDKRGLVLFLRQYDFVVDEDMVNKSVVEAARLLYHLDLHEQKFLKLLCGSIKEFVDVLPVTKDWSLLKFVTALKFYCYPGARYQIWRPSKIFSGDEYKRIASASMKPQYRKLIMSKIHLVSVYEDAIDLYGDRLDLVYNIDCLMPEKAKPKTVLNSATGDNGSGVTVRRSSELDLSGKPRQIVTCDKQAADTDAKQAGAARSMDETEDKNLTGGTHGLVGDKQDGVIPAIIPRFGPIQNEERITPKFVERLRDIQGKHDELEKKFFEERGSLEAKYQKLYEPLYSKRLKILTGVGEVQGITQSCDGTPAKQEEGKGVPDFWLNAMIINEILGEEIQERDEEALKYLKDIKWCRIVDPKGFKLEFFFDTNPFFKNSVLAKTYHIDEEDEPILEKAIGTEIDWCRGKCLTQNVLKKKPKKGSKNTKPITIVEDCESFFKFFSPTEVPNDDKEIDDS